MLDDVLDLEPESHRKTLLPTSPREWNNLYNGEVDFSPREPYDRKRPKHGLLPRSAKEWERLF